MLSFEDDEEPIFDNPPADQTYDCFFDIPALTDLSYTDNCVGSGLAQGVESGSFTICNGGTMLREWIAVDSCNNTAIHKQTITIDPIPPATILNPPGDEVIDCSAIPVNAPDLMYDNNGTGGCNISGSISPTTTGSADLCGGTLTNVWETTDTCGRVISHTQVITVNPVPEADFINPPADITVTCDAVPTSAPDLAYTNGENGICEIAGIATPVLEGSGDECGGTISYKWQFIDACGRMKNHSQIITITPMSPPAFINPPADTMVECDAIPTTAPDLFYTNGEIGSCEVMGSVSPTMTGGGDECGGSIVWTWDFTDPCGNNIKHIQTITIIPIPPASFINPPADITVTCDAIPSSTPDLAYTNNTSGACEIAGMVSATVSGMGDECGGDIINMWEFTDQCGRTITHVQTISITPIPEAAFLNLPPDQTVACNAIPSPAADLLYTNSESGTCEISGSVAPVITDNSSSCGGTIQNLWEFTDQCGRTISHTQVVSVDPAPQGSFINPPADITVACDQLPSAPGNLMLTNSESGICLIESNVPGTVIGSPSPCGGTIQNQWTYTDVCGRVTTHTQNITITQTAQATFDSPPADITVDCNNIPANGIPLNYSNGLVGFCAISGSVNAVRTGSSDECGGVLTDTWTFVDPCGRITSTSRTITVNPAPKAVFSSLPGDLVVECIDVNDINLSLTYDNGESGNCLISGTATAVVTGIYDECGGTLLNTWTYTDDCNRTITHSRNVIVEPAADPQFINPPVDTIIPCGGTYTPPTAIEYSNFETGFCEISGLAFVNTIETDFEQINEWIFNHPCDGTQYIHTQVVTFIQSPDIEIDPDNISICLGDAFDLSTITVTDNNNTDPVITYHDGTPPNSFNETDPLVSPTGTSLYSIQATSAAGCTDYKEVFVYVTEPNLAGDDVSVTVCKDGNTINLDSYLSSDASANGYWSDQDNTGIDVSNSSSVNINNIPPGVYNLYYITFPIDACPEDQALLTLTILDEVIYTITDVSCSADNSSYIITVTTNGNTLTSSGGTINTIDANTVEIVDIPISQQVTLIIGDPNSGCSEERIVNPPNCDCPDVAPPTGIPDYRICPEEIPIDMTVIVESGLSANWYDSQAGLVPLESKTLIFAHTNNVPGLYTYFVEAIDTITDCVSQDRFEISVEVVAPPSGNDVNPKLCDDDSDGFVAFDFNTIGNEVNNNPNNSKTFYISLADAESEMNPLSSPFTNTEANQVLYVVVKNPTGCVSIYTATLTVLPLPTFGLQITNETCLGDGDGIILLDNIIANGSVLTSLNGAAYQNSVQYDSLEAGVYSIVVQDTAGCENEMSFNITEGLELTLDEYQLNCDNKGTLSDATDDDYIFSFNVANNLGVTNEFILFIDNVEVGRYTYGSLHTITLPADGATIQVLFQDVETGCSINRIGGPLNPCSTTCVLTIDDLTFTCNDNGTDDNPADDFYEVIINVSSVNGSAANTYSLFVDGVLRGAGMYGEDFTFNMPASPNDVVINIQDSEDNQCQIDTTLSNLEPCSDGCLVFLNIVNVECDNNGTILDKTDDFYTISVIAESVNTGSSTFELLIDQVAEGTYTYEDTITFTINADGLDHVLEAVDSNRPECNAETNTGILTNCSTDCEILLTVSTPICDNNGTNDDPSDDTYTFTIQATGGRGNGWTNPALNISANYGETVTVGPLLISNGSFIFSAIDNDIPECNTDIQITPPQPCSGCAQTMSLEANGTIDCNNPSILLEATVSEPGTYLWTFQGGQVSNQLTGMAGSEGWYVFSVSFPDNCFLIDSVFVESDDDIPVANGGPDKILTCTIDSVKLDGSLSSQGSGLIYEWTDMDGNVISNEIEIIVFNPGEYFLQVIDSQSNCISAKDLVVVEQYLDIPSTAIYANPGDAFDCIIAEIILTTDMEPNTEYSWITPEAIFNGIDFLGITEIGEYILVATNTLSECVDTGSIEILSFEEYPIIELSVDEELDCDINSVMISAEGSQTGSTIIYSWYDMDGNLIDQTVGQTTVQEPGYYTLILEDTENGCTNSDSIEVISLETEVGIDIDPIIEVQQGDKIVLRPIVNIPLDEIDTIIWDPTDGLSCTDCLEPEVLIDQNRTYTITIIDVYGCIGTASVTIRARFKNEVTVPNVINSDSDVGNDVFVIFTDDDNATIHKVLIYDRWGNKVYDNRDQLPNSPVGAWNGTLNNNDVAQGVYVYLVEITLSSGQFIRLTGDVTVLR
jgi:hypothetical protein